MKRRIPKLVPAMIAMLAMAGCVAPPPPPPPPPPPSKPVMIKVPPSPPVLVQPQGSWTDWPITDGDWIYRRDATGSVADYVAGDGGIILSFRCDVASRRVVMALTEQALFNGMSMHVVTTSAMRNLAARREMAGNGVARIIAEIPAHDPVLDAVIFSRGRFAVEAAGQLSIAVPAWPEIGHVVEDCRNY